MVCKRLILVERGTARSVTSLSRTPETKSDTSTGEVSDFVSGVREVSASTPDEPPFCSERAETFCSALDDALALGAEAEAPRPGVGGGAAPPSPKPPSASACAGAGSPAEAPPTQPDDDDDPAGSEELRAPEAAPDEDVVDDPAA